VTDKKKLETIVFIDAQNVYRTAREAFLWENESSRLGNFKALLLGQLLTAAEDRELKQVRVYTGAPSQEHDLQGYSASRKRFDTWTYEGHGKVQVCERNLHYRPGEPPREKGVDVLLAIHLVRFALTPGLMDLAVVVSADNDLVPALELVADVKGSAAVESVSLEPEPGGEAGAALGVRVTEKRTQIARRLITRQEYDAVRDDRSYNPNSPDSNWSTGPLPGQSGRQLPRRP
jgi:uncharacterized LabA/DUF88 family protein